jgi:hypothetical protein
LFAVNPAIKGTTQTVNVDAITSVIKSAANVDEKNDERNKDNDNDDWI